MANVLKFWQISVGTDHIIKKNFCVYIIEKNLIKILKVNFVNDNRYNF